MIDKRLRSVIASTQEPLRPISLSYYFDLGMYCGCFYVLVSFSGHSNQVSSTQACRNRKVKISEGRWLKPEVLHNRWSASDTAEWMPFVFIGQNCEDSNCSHPEVTHLWVLTYVHKILKPAVQSMHNMLNACWEQCSRFPRASQACIGVQNSE